MLVRVAIQDHFLCFVFTLYAVHVGHSCMRLCLAPLTSHDNAHLQKDVKRRNALRKEPWQSTVVDLCLTSTYCTLAHPRGIFFPYITNPPNKADIYTT